MFIKTRKRDNKEFKYLEHSFRIGNRIKKISIYLPEQENFEIEEFQRKNKIEIEKIVKERIAYIKKNCVLNKFYLYEHILENIEGIKINFQIMMNLLNDEGKKEVLKEFLRTFIANSMEMEGGTVTYDIAKKIDLNKLTKKQEDVAEADIKLYRNIQNTYELISKERIRSAQNIARIHAMMYQGVYSFAGKFRRREVTFGVTENAITADFKNIKKNLLAAIKNFKNKKQGYIFENILEFHANYQAIHPFQDGNSRLGRLIVARDFMNDGYPPPILKKSNAIAYRSSLVKAINHQNYTPLFKLYYQVYKKTWYKFFKPLLEEKIKQGKTIL